MGGHDLRFLFVAGIAGIIVVSGLVFILTMPSFWGVKAVEGLGNQTFEGLEEEIQASMAEERRYLDQQISALEEQVYAEEDLDRRAELEQELNNLRMMREQY